MDDILLYSLASQSRNPKDYAISTVALSVEPYGIMLRRDDPAFKKVVDNAMIQTYKSGAINGIYDKWFQKPVPPRNINLNVPMSEQFKKVIEPDRFGRPRTTSNSGMTRGLRPRFSLQGERVSLALAVLQTERAWHVPALPAGGPGLDARTAMLGDRARPGRAGRHGAHHHGGWACA
jgi:hypothetical protein